MNVSRRAWLGVLALGLAIAWLSAGVRAEDKKPAGSVTGTWKSTFKTPDGKSFEIIYKLKQEGEKLTGTVTGPGGRETKIEEGKVKDGKVSFQVTRERDGNKFTIKYEGELSGDAIKGKAEVGDRSRDWEAKREKTAADKKTSK
jgi:hypothetical protein